MRNQNILKFQSSQKTDFEIIFLLLNFLTETAPFLLPGVGFLSALVLTAPLLFVCVFCTEISRLKKLAWKC